jgi:Linalool dehydratase/isomerase
MGLPAAVSNPQSRANATPLLDDKQAGHIRRIRNLAAQLPDDWSGMMGRSSLQEDFGTLRFQLAYMAYVLGLAHVHHLPAAPAVFRKPFDQLIMKMLSPDVWTYWHYVSTGNGPLNKALGELPPRWNPVETDNIMYSAYIQSMSLMFHYLFDDAKYAAEGALTMRMQPLFWGADGQHFPYDERKLNEHVYWTMVQKGYLGIACEPNCVFQICNQVPILGFRLHDFIYGGDTAKEVTEGYLRAWSDFGILDAGGHYNIVVQEREHALVARPPLPWADFWLGALMHAWNPDFVKANYPRHMARWSKEGPDGTLWIAPAIPPAGFGKELSNARDFGWAAACASEVGDADALQSMLAYADRFLNPVWQDGAYFYQRRDGWFDDHGRLAAMDPHTGNALIAYARLNVPDGLRKLYDRPWDERHFREPALVDMPDDLDVRGALYEADRASLLLNLRAGGSGAHRVKIGISNVWNRGDWTLHLDDEQVAGGTSTAPGDSDAVGLRRDGDLLTIEGLLAQGADLCLTWH